MTIDAVTKGDLKNIALACRMLPEETVMAGAAGFASFLAKVMDLPSDTLRESPSKEGIILIVAGTCNPTTRKQIDEVMKNTDANLIKINTGKIINGFTADEVEKVVCEMHELNKTNGVNGRISIIAVDSLFNANLYSSQIKKWGKTIAQAIGIIVERLVNDQIVQSLVITGGDTALHVLNALKAKGIELEEEVLPGIPLGRLIGGKANDTPIITKAGGFGTPTAFLEVVKYLQTKETTMNVKYKL